MVSPSSRTYTALSGQGLKTGRLAPPQVQGDLPHIARSATTLLFQPLDTKTYSVPGLSYVYDYETETPTGGPGPTGWHVDKRAGYSWRNVGGDVVDSTFSVVAASATTQHWVTFAANSGNGATYNTDVTSLLQWVQQQGRHAAFSLRHGGSSFRTLATHRHPTTTWRPQLSVVYVGDSEPTILSATIMAAAEGSRIPSTFGDTLSAPVFLEFPRPQRAVQSASLRITVTQQFGSTAPMSLNPLDPPASTPTLIAGVAEGFQFDSGLKNAAGVIYVHTYRDADPQSYWVSPTNYNLYDVDFSPEFYGGEVDTSKLPYSEMGADLQGRWTNANYAGQVKNLTLVPSTYSAENHRPLAPGLASLRVLIPGSNLVDGYDTGVQGTEACIASLWLPSSKLGSMRRMRLRYYFRFHFSRPLVPSDRKIAANGGGGHPYVQHSGKWGPTPDFRSNIGGVSGTSGGTRGGQLRNGWIASNDGTPGASAGRISIGTHMKDDYLIPVNYANDLNFNEMYGDGGYAAGIFPDRWYLFECDAALNTLTNTGLGSVADGVHKVWIDKHLVYDRAGLNFRANPPCRYVGAMVPSYGTNAGNGTVTDLATYVSGRNADLSQRFSVPHEVLTVTFLTSTTYQVIGSFSGSINPTGAVGASYESARGHRFRINAGASNWAAGDVVLLTYPPFLTVPAATTWTPTNGLGWHSLWLCVYHGGKSLAHIDKTLFVAGLALGDGDVMTGPFGSMGGVTLT